MGPKPGQHAGLEAFPSGLSCWAQVAALLSLVPRAPCAWSQASSKGNKSYFAFSVTGWNYA